KGSGYSQGTTLDSSESYSIIAKEDAGETDTRANKQRGIIIIKYLWRSTRVVYGDHVKKGLEESTIELVHGEFGDDKLSEGLMQHSLSLEAHSYDVNDTSVQEEQRYPKGAGTYQEKGCTSMSSSDLGHNRAVWNTMSLDPISRTQVETALISPSISSAKLTTIAALNKKEEERYLLMIPWNSDRHWGLLVSVRGEEKSMYLLDSYYAEPLKVST
ncbi:hypothetical protein PROFUN_04676, partial [Planoprotostelium fungivorum]